MLVGCCYTRCCSHTRTATARGSVRASAFAHLPQESRSVWTVGCADEALRRRRNGSARRAREGLRLRRAARLGRARARTEERRHHLGTSPLARVALRNGEAARGAGVRTHLGIRNAGRRAPARARVARAIRVCCKAGDGGPRREARERYLTRTPRRCKACLTPRSAIVSDARRYRNLTSGQRASPASRAAHSRWAMSVSQLSTSPNTASASSHRSLSSRNLTHPSKDFSG